MLVYAVYAKSKIKLFRRDIIYETFVMKYIAFPFCIFLDCSSLDAWASLAFCKNFLDFSGFNISERLTLLKPL